MYFVRVCIFRFRLVGDQQMLIYFFKILGGIKNKKFIDKRNNYFRSGFGNIET